MSRVYNLCLSIWDILCIINEYTLKFSIRYDYASFLNKNGNNFFKILRQFMSYPMSFVCYVMKHIGVLGELWMKQTERPIIQRLTLRKMRWVNFTCKQDFFK